ncbi:MAG: hypothetical protein ACJ71Q_05915 [Terriglobales bacterium]
MAKRFAGLGENFFGFSMRSDFHRLVRAASIEIEDPTVRAIFMGQKAVSRIKMQCPQTAFAGPGGITEYTKTLILRKAISLTMK